MADDLSQNLDKTYPSQPNNWELISLDDKENVFSPDLSCIYLHIPFGFVLMRNCLIGGRQIVPPSLPTCFRTFLVELVGVVVVLQSHIIPGYCHPDAATRQDPAPSLCVSN